MVFWIDILNSVVLGSVLDPTVYICMCARILVWMTMMGATTRITGACVASCSPSSGPLLTLTILRNTTRPLSSQSNKDTLSHSLSLHVCLFILLSQEAFFPSYLSSHPCSLLVCGASNSINTSWVLAVWRIVMSGCIRRSLVIWFRGHRVQEEKINSLAVSVRKNNIPSQSM